MSQPREPVVSAGHLAGLCETCCHARIVASRRTRFTLCERSFSDARYPRYPRLPVLTCSGFVGASGREGPETAGCET